MRRNQAKPASGTYDLRQRWLVEVIRKRGLRRVLLQLPEGLKQYGLELASLIENETGALAIISADPCYGACDLASDEAKLLGADLIVHYGHSMLKSKTETPAVYIEARSNLRIDETVKRSLPLIKNFHRIGLATTAQHAHRLNDARRILSESGKEVLVGAASGRVKHHGQILGCDFSTAKAIADRVDGFLFIGGGYFHPVGLALSTGKPVVAADPYLKKVGRISGLLRKTLRQRWAVVCKAREARRIGILVGLKTGQMNLERALEIRREIEKQGKEAVILCLREITPQSVSSFHQLDALIDTACPRIAVDDAPGFRQVILTIDEAEVMLGRKSWGDHIGGGTSYLTRAHGLQGSRFPIGRKRVKPRHWGYKRIG